MLLSSHRVDELLSLVNRVVEMDCGSIVLDERLNGGISRGRLMGCELTLHEVNDSIRKILETWQFRNGSGPGRYQGEIAEEDRIRFISAISHFSHHIQELQLGKP